MVTSVGWDGKGSYDVKQVRMTRACHVKEGTDLNTARAWYRCIEAVSIEERCYLQTPMML
jgi:hypothetical protein